MKQVKNEWESRFKTSKSSNYWWDCTEFSAGIKWTLVTVLVAWFKPHKQIKEKDWTYKVERVWFH